MRVAFVPTDSPFPEPSGRKCRIGGGPVATVVLILLPVLYVLSEGPVAGLVARGYLPQGFDLVFYWPLNWIAARSDAISLALAWYENIWMP